MLIYKIAEAAQWVEAMACGAFDGSADDKRDGFIHFSTATQARETAAKHFAGRAGLVLVAVHVEHLGALLKWEPSRGGALFPHVYGALPMTAVAWARPLPVGADGHHAFPDEVV